MTETTQDLLARLTGFTPGPWGIPENKPVFGFWNGCYMPVDWDGMGRLSLFSVTAGPDHAAPNAALIAAAPDLHRIATEQAAEIARLREALGDAIELAHGVSFSDSPIMASWGQRVEVKARAALDAQP